MSHGRDSRRRRRVSIPSPAFVGSFIDDTVGFITPPTSVFSISLLRITRVSSSHKNQRVEVNKRDKHGTSLNNDASTNDALATRFDPRVDVCFVIEVVLPSITPIV